MKRLLLATGVLGVFAQNPVSFNRDIRPIMSDTCFRCHGPDASSRMANLRLDRREDAVRPNRRGMAAIVPGEPDKSLIIQRVFDSGARIMPPASAHKTLSLSQKDTIRRWVAEGAKYEGHWAYEPIRRTPNASIDAFIQARLDRNGLTPAAEADRPTLIRRVALDLTGLPPTPEEIDAFASDTSPNAYERLVDRLLASPRYAEKQAIHWLDAVRYADTAGYHGDNPFPAWPYRDYVLRSIHENQPFDQFTREQLAGDLLPNATPAQRTASAYNRILRVSAEGGVQDKEYLAKYGADRVRTTASVWLGSTLGCAECHDHKFDPFLARDFYSMKAFFADIQETGLVPDRGPKAWGATLDLPSPGQESELERLNREIAKADRRVASLRSAAREKDLLARSETGAYAWRFQRPVDAEAISAKLTIYNDDPPPTAATAAKPRPGNGLVVASGPNPDRDTYMVTIVPGQGRWTQLGIQIGQDESLAGLGVARGGDLLMISEVEVETLPYRHKIRFSAAASSVGFRRLEQHPMNAIDGDPATGWGGSPYHDGVLPFLVLRMERPLVTTEKTRLRIRLRHETAHRKATPGRFRIALSSGLAPPRLDPTSRKLEPAEVKLSERLVTALRKPAGERTGDEQTMIERALEWSNSSSILPLAARLTLEARRDRTQISVPRVMVTEATKPAETRILARGNFLDESGPIVEPAIPAFLGKLEVPGRATRLDLANWLVSRDNPLTARAYVNRQWRIFFGTGLSKVLDDLGSQGEWPVYPELLDYLAADFMDHGWNRKRLTKLIVMSHAYRQSSDGITPNDPDNRLLARQNRLRVDAEVVRDIALSVSGLLAERFGGPSVRPYQPEGYLTALNFPKRDYSASRGADQYRRGLYTFWQRTFLHPSLVAFDAASREECTVNRSVSNTPLQALVLLNDPTFVEASRVFAQKTLLEAGSRKPEDRIAWAFRRAVGRAPAAAEQSALMELYHAALQRFDSNPAEARSFIANGEAPKANALPPAELAATMTVTRAILNLHETITRN